MKKFLVVVTIIIVGCDRYDTSLTITNRTKSAIIVEMCEDSIYKSDLNDNRLDLDNTNGFGYKNYKINPNCHLEQLGVFNTTWKSIIDRSYNKKLNLYIFKWDSLIKYRSMDSLYFKKNYKKLEITRDLLDSLHWIVEVED
jgi:hypothetical protein